MLPERKIAWEQWIDYDVEDDGDVLTKDDDEEGGGEHMLELIPLMLRTPIGIYSPMEPMSPSKMFDCWIGHTNFDLNEGHKQILNRVAGIEVLKIMTRYRFFIGIGKLFSLTDVRPRVEAVLNIGYRSMIATLMEEISGKVRWAIAIYADGSYRSISTNEAEDTSYDDQLVRLKNSGVLNIVTSEGV